MNCELQRGVTLDICYDWYKVFYKVAQSKNISYAAKNLNISQPAVSRTIKELEAVLCCDLFYRTKKGVKLTAEGELLFSYISKAMEQITLGEKNLAARLNLESGEILIGASDMTLEYFLLPHLERFHKLYPHIKIGVTNGASPTTLTALKDEKIDFCAVSAPVPEMQGFSSTKVREIEDIFIAGAKFAHLKNIPITKKNLVMLPIISLGRDTSTRKYVDEYFARDNLEIKPEFELSTSSLIVQFTKKNLGVGCVVKDFALEEINKGEIFQIELCEEIPKRDIYIVRKKDVLSKAAEELLSLIHN